MGQRKQGNPMSPRYLLSLMLCSAPLLAFDVPYSPTPPVIDGANTESQWQQSAWRPLNFVTIGGPLDPSDFDGKYRLMWDKNYLYLQAKITDDMLYDNNPNPIDGYWSDDCLEIFVDEDASGGDHQYNHNAFAYHIGLDNQAVDLSTDKKARLYNDHVISRWQREQQPPYDIVWEVAISIYDDSFEDNKSNQPVTLDDNKKLGFMLAYCDNDASKNREHFIGSKDITPVNGDKNRGWIDASVFDQITLTK